MQLELLPIASPVPMEMYTLYNESFPLYERRPWQEQLALLRNGKLQLYQLSINNALAGCLFAWQLSSCYFIEHFAIVPAFRGAGIGSGAMQLAIQRFSSIALEVEPPSQSADATRRMAFYTRLGFRVFEESYHQPPYAAGYPSLPMCLMYYGTGLKAANFKALQAEIYLQVYNKH